eukprot:gene20735-27551_t
MAVGDRDARDNLKAPPISSYRKKLGDKEKFEQFDKKAPRFGRGGSRGSSDTAAADGNQALSPALAFTLLAGLFGSFLFLLVKILTKES